MGGCFQMKKFVFFCLISFLFSGCGVSDDEKFNRGIIGTSAVRIGGEYEIVSDIQLSDLTIRHVKSIHEDEQCALPSQNHHEIQISGLINSDTWLVVQRLINKIKSASNRCASKENGRPYAVTIYLSSGGGYLADGIELGRIFRKEGVSVRIPYGAKCFSSCAVAFIGGFFRVVEGNGELLFHAPLTRSGALSRSVGASPRPSDCQTSNSELQSYFISMLGGENGNLLYNRTMSNCSSIDGWVINKDAAKIMGIATE